MTTAHEPGVELARAAYRDLWRTAAELDCWCQVDHGSVAPCGGWLWLDVEAASLTYDLANAEASIERLRAAVAWA